MSQPPYPPSPPGGWPPPPPKKPKAPLFLGMLIGAVAPFLGVLVPILFSGNSGAASDAVAFAPFVWVMLILATGAGLLFSDRTRRWGVGILIGLFGMLIIGAGVCVAALVVVLSAYNGG